jgi:hypothetical protein
MQRNPLTKIDSPIVECLPVQAELEVVLQVDACIGTRSDRPEGGSQFLIMDPDLDVLAVHEHV